MEGLFGYGFWNQTVLEVTHWAYDEHSIKAREHDNKTEEWWTSMMNAHLQDRYHLHHNLSVSINYVHLKYKIRIRIIQFNRI